MGTIIPHPSPMPLSPLPPRGGEPPVLLRLASGKASPPPPRRERGEGLGEVVRVTFEDTASLPFDLCTGQLSEELLSENDQLFQRLWRTYFKAICIKERMNPRKQLNDMPRRYWAYMTEKQ